MNIKCQECSKEFHIPEKQISGPRLEFICSNCQHKIVVMTKKERGAGRQPVYRALSAPFLTIKNLLDGIFYSFNLKNTILSFLVHLGLIFLLSPFVLIVYYNIEFFTAHPALSGFLVFFLIVVFSYAYDIHLYLLSLNAYSRINTGRSMQFSAQTEYIINDIKSVFIVSSGVFIVFMILLLPLFLLDTEWGIVYEGFLYIAILILALSLIVILYFKKIIYAFIANKQRSIKNNFLSFMRFIIIENINIPIYMFFTGAITSMIGFIVFGLIFTVILLVAVITALSLIPQLLPGLASPNIADNLPALYSIVPHLTGVGGILIAATTFSVLLFLFAYIVNLRQTLAAVSVQIMKSNPVESINRNAVIIAVLLVSLMASSMISSIIIALGTLFKQ